MPPIDLDGTRAQVERWQRAWDEDGYCQWAACDLESGRLIGRIGILCHHDWPLSDRPVPEVGWVLDHDFWGQGLATEGGLASVAVWREHLPDEPRLLSITTPREPPLARGDEPLRAEACAAPPTGTATTSSGTR